MNRSLINNAVIGSSSGYVFITNVSGSPKTMRLEMRWDNNFSGDMSKKDIIVP